MNLYVVLSALDDWEPWIVLVVARSRSAAKYAVWRGYSGGEDLVEATYSIRLVQKAVESVPCVVDDGSVRPEWWALARERTGYYMRAEDS